MINRYFVINKSDLTYDILDNAISGSNPYFLRSSLDNTKIIIKCNCKAVSIDLFKLNLIPKTKEEMILFLNDPMNGFTEGS